MSWNYRLIDYGSHVAVHEVYYDDEGKPTAYTTRPVYLSGDTLEDIEADVGLILSDLKRLPPLKESELPK